MIKKFLKLVTASLVVFAISPTTAHAEVSVFWDFSPGNGHGWTTVNGTAWFADDGVGAGQATGGGIDGYFGGINTTGSTRNAHDGAHVNFLYRSSTINFATVHPTDPVLEFDWFGGAGNQEGAADIANPTAEGFEGTVTTGAGQKGLALLNLTTGDYDAIYYDPTNGNGTESFSLTQADLTGAGVSLTDNYQLDFFENDDGGWGWTRLNEVRLDGAALIDMPFNVNWDFNDGERGDHNWKIENGFASFSTDGVHASQDGSNFSENAAHAAMLFRSPMIDFSRLDPDQDAIEVNFIGGQGNQGGAPEPAGPDTIFNYNGGNSDANGQKGLAFFNLTTGIYDHVLYDSENGGNNPESISLTQAELVAAGIDIDEVYRLDFFDYDDGASGWTRLESVNLNGLVIPDPPPPPPPPSETVLTWDFSPGKEHGWTTVNGTAWFAGDGVGAGQADGGGIAGYFGGVNASGATRNAHDGAHVNFLFRSPTINFATVHPTDPVLEFDWFGGAGNPGGAADIANPTAVGLGGTVTTDVGQKGLALLNLTTGDYDAIYYDPTNGNGTESFSLTQADLTGAGVSLTDDYQLDFFDNDDGGWGWTRLNEVRLDSTALGESTGRIEITDIDYSPDTNSVTLTWDSREGVTYVVNYSKDMTDWSADIDDSVIGDVGNQTTRTFELRGLGIVDQRKIFFRVDR
ncbi:MAG: hypothetical protein ACJAQT_003642 [Akkermansiaceae bacterium]|jgi:hypothetical protein